MDAQGLLLQLRRQRELRITVDAGDAARGVPAVVFVAQRPPMGDWDKFVAERNGERVMSCDWSLAVQYVTDWQITEAQILGPELAPGDPVPFDRILCENVLADNMAWSKAIGEALIEAILAAHEKRKAARGN